MIYQTTYNYINSNSSVLVNILVHLHRQPRFLNIFFVNSSAPNTPFLAQFLSCSGNLLEFFLFEGRKGPTSNNGNEETISSDCRVPQCQFEERNSEYTAFYYRKCASFGNEIRMENERGSTFRKHGFSIWKIQLLKIGNGCMNKI